MDNGAIIIQGKISHCTCQAGEAFKYNGMQCEKSKSPYYIPSVAEVIAPEILAAENFHAWWEANKKKDGIEQAMQERGIPIPKDEGRQAGNDEANE